MNGIVGNKENDEQRHVGLYLPKFPLLSLFYQVMVNYKYTRATHVRTRVCPRVELILKIIIILLIIFLGFI